MPKQQYFKQNHGQLSPNPPKYLGSLAARCWRRVVPYLGATKRVERIDTGIVEQYCTAYELYRQAYENVQKNGIQSKLFKSVQNSAGEVIARDFVGFRKNPAVATMNDMLKQLKSLGHQLGLSPSARQELMQIADKGDKGDTLSEMKKFFSK